MRPFRRVATVRNLVVAARPWFLDARRVPSNQPRFVRRERFVDVIQRLIDGAFRRLVFTDWSRP